jgi:hypothetical protein
LENTKLGKVQSTWNEIELKNEWIDDYLEIAKQSNRGLSLVRDRDHCKSANCNTR